MNPGKISNREFRMIVTQNCNYKCVFCHKEGLQTKQEDELSPEDFKLIYKIGKKYFGMKSTTLTGGEPLIRKDIVDIARKIKEEGAYITLTTNGFFLKDHIEIGRYINRINVSLHTLDAADYEKIVQKECSFLKVIEGLLLLKKMYPSVEIRLNATLIKGVNSSEKSIRNYISYAKSLNASIKFVELYPKKSKGFISIKKVQKIIEGMGFHKTSQDAHKINYGKDGLIVGLGQIFCVYAENTKDPCGHCRKYNDLFLTPNGKIKPCRSSLREVEMLNEVKNKDSKKIYERIKSALNLLGEECTLRK